MLLSRSFRAVSVGFAVIASLLVAYAPSLGEALGGFAVYSAAGWICLCASNTLAIEAMDRRAAANR